MTTACENYITIHDKNHRSGRTMGEQDGSRGETLRQLVQPTRVTSRAHGGGRR